MERKVCELPCDLIVREGLGKNSGKPYRMTLVRIYTDLGVAEFVLNTRIDRAGIILDMTARKEEAKNG